MTTDQFKQDQAEFKAMQQNIAKLSKEAQDAWRKSREVEVERKDAQGNVIGTTKTTSLAGMAPEREPFFKDLATTQTLDEEDNVITIPDYQADPVAYGKAQQAYQQALAQSNVAALEKAAFGKDPQAELARLPGMLGQLFGTPERISGFRSLSREQQVAELQRSALDARNRGDAQTAALIESMIQEILNPTVYDPTQEGGLRPISAYSAYRSSLPVPGRGEIGMTGLNRSNQVFDRAFPLRTTGGFPTDIAFLASGGAINKPTMAVVGEAGPELAMLQPGDAIIPLSKKQANQLLDSGTPGYQQGLYPDVRRGAPIQTGRKTLLEQAGIELGGEGMPFQVNPGQTFRRNPTISYQPDILQSFMPDPAPSAATILRNIGIPSPGAMGTPGGAPMPDPILSGTESMPDVTATDPGGSAASLSIPPAALAPDEYMRLLSLAETGEFTNEDLGNLLKEQDRLRSDINRIRLERANLPIDEITGEADVALAASLDAELAVAQGQLDNLNTQINALTQIDTSAEALSESRAREVDPRAVEREKNIAFGNFATQLFNSLGIEFPPEIMAGIAGGDIASSQLGSLLSLFLSERARQEQTEQEQTERPQAIQYGFA